MASTTRPTTDRRKKPVTTTSAVGVPAAGAATLPHAEIARKAYELFCARGCEHGRDLDDWFRAERELSAGPARAPRRAARPTVALD